MILFGSSLSPFARKVLVFASEKGIELELRPTGRDDPDPEFVRASPFRKMPALVDGEFTLADSSAIVHYLEARTPEPILIPPEPQERGRVIWFDEFADTILFDCGRKMFFNRVVAPLFFGREGDREAADRAEREELPPVLQYLEEVVPDDGGFLVGERLSLADISVASPFVNLRHMDVEIDRGLYPRLLTYVNHVLSRPSFQCLIELENKTLEGARERARTA